MMFFSEIWFKITTSISAVLMSIAISLAPSTPAASDNSVPLADGERTATVELVESSETVVEQTQVVNSDSGVEISRTISQQLPENQGISMVIETPAAIMTVPTPPQPTVVVEVPSLTIRTSIIASSHGWEHKNGVSYPAQGIYTIALDITAGNQDVLIPQTTTDSTKGETGVSYSVHGDKTFSGERKSEVTCGSGIAYGNSCVVHAGTTERMTATIWLMPIADGTFGVTFNNIGYKITQYGELNKYPVNKETEGVYIPF